MAGHEHHFLSRLDRVSHEHVDLALTLYRDHDALRFVLQRAVTQGGERVAISLDDPLEGPFVVVTRQGRFVTCLAAGMKPGDLEIVPRERLDGLIKVYSDFRDRVAAKKVEVERTGSLSRLFLRIAEAGPYLTREEFFAMSAVTPLLLPELLVMLAKQGVEVATTRLALARLLSRLDFVKPREFARFEGFWKITWSLGHLAMLLAKDGREFIEHTLEDQPEIARALTITLTSCGTVGLALRGAWAAAKIGKPLVPFLKRTLADAKELLHVNDAIFCLTAIAVRHQRLRGEISKALAAPLTCEDASLVGYAKWLASCAERALDAADPRAFTQGFGAARWLRATAHLPASSPLRFASKDDVPFEIALPSALLSPLDFLHAPNNARFVVHGLAAVARADAEELFFSEAHVRAVRHGSHVDDAIELLAGWREIFLTQTASKPEGPPRQGPCPCGSGKKYKRCCEGRAPAS